MARERGAHHRSEGAADDRSVPTADDLTHQRAGADDCAEHRIGGTGRVDGGGTGRCNRV